MESPPKRVTRARAAAKKDDPAGPRTSRIATTSSKAKATRVVAPVTKRKTRADDEKEKEDVEEHTEEQHADNNIIEPMGEASAPVKTARGRPKKTTAVQHEDEEMADIPAPAPAPVKATRGRAATLESDKTQDIPAPTKAVRGRPKKIIIDTPAAIEPARATRGRPKKVDAPEETRINGTEEPVKRATRGRAAAPLKPALKKSVKFDEPDKENIVHVTGVKGKEKAQEVGTGLRAKPVRKPASSTATRATRGRKVEETTGSSPLSPKKVTQVGSTAKETSSDDELSTSVKTPLKPLMKSPVKPAGNIFSSAKKLDFSSSAATTVTVNRMATQDLTASVMASPARRPPQSPFKDAMKTSPQRSTFQGSMLQSPFKPSLQAPKPAEQDPSFKASLLQSPARRPASPAKVNEAGSPSRGQAKGPSFGTTPKATPFKISRFATPRTLNIGKNVVRTGQMAPPSAPPKFSTGSPKGAKQDNDSTLMGPPPLKFSGRLSSIMPRSADPALSYKETVVEEVEPSIAVVEELVDDMDIDPVDQVTVESVDQATTTPPATPPRNSTGEADFRNQHECPFDDSDSEDELASGSVQYSPLPMSSEFRVSAHDFASSPVEFKAISTPKPAKSARKSLAAMRSEKKDKIGFTPLAIQLTNWMAASPEKSEFGDEEATSPTPESSHQAPEQSLNKSTFFEDAMTVHDEITATPVVETLLPEIDQIFGPAILDEQDLALADEADEMSLLEPDQLATHEDADMFEVQPEIQTEFNDQELDELLRIDNSVVEFQEVVEPVNALDNEVRPETSEELQQTDAGIIDQAIDQPEVVESNVQAEPVEPALSEASQEYGDENAMSLDPALFNTQNPPKIAPTYSTPKRVLTERTYHTVSKVPLKAAAEDTPMRPSPAKRSASISRLPTQRPTTNLTRKNTVISYSPSRSTPKAKTPQRAQVDATPSKSEWSAVATPARTPRRDINPGLLRGAVVFVNVHTTEGADASVLFTELLTQMGAKCVKHWTWTGAGEDKSKIGITHVVFKDGGKRTLEKARESDGIVTCVGVGWVLDCERENQWLSEAPYIVDTALIPRGGHRRRKSMEPKALANLNGTIIPTSSTPSRTVSWDMSSSKEVTTGTPLTSKSHRRDSVLWFHSPASSSEGGSEMDDLLLPVPATPAPEQISAYGDEGLYGGDETPTGQTPYFLRQEQLVQQTAPAKRYLEGAETSEGSENRTSNGMNWLLQKKDESVVQRLMAARRKSLQFAPKIGSPLARGFKG